MDEGELIVKIDNLEKRVEVLEKQISTIAQINQSERVKEYIASAEKASKIAKLLDAAIEAIREASRTGKSGFVWHTTGSGKNF